MSTKKDMKRADLSKHENHSQDFEQLLILLNSNPVSNPYCERERRYQRNFGQHIANGSDVHKKQVHWMVCGAHGREGDGS